MRMNSSADIGFTIPVLAAGMLMLASTVACAEANFFAGATIGQAEIGDYELQAESDIKLDDTDTGYRIFFGYGFNPYVAIGASYLDLGALNAEGTAFGGFTDKIEATGIEAFVMGMVPVSDKLTLFATAGVFSWDQDVTYQDDFETFKGSADGEDAAFGAGLNYWITDSIGVHAEWHRYQKVGDLNVTGHQNDRDFYGAGFVVRFGS